MKEKSIKILYQEFESIKDISNEEKLLLETAKEAAKKAYAPYSNFYVGAALLLEDDTIVIGNNQENNAFPSGLCAERVAVFAASSQFPEKQIKAIAITATSAKINIDYPVSPCGACRQVLFEAEFKQKSNIKVILSGNSGKAIILNSVTDLMPLNFFEEELKK